PSITFGGFGVSDLRGFSPATPNGTYALIDGIATTNTNNLINFGPANAYGLGGGRSAYFDVVSGLTLVVVPEPSVVALAGIGLALAAAQRLRRRRS
ncbi:MAG: PEP-CTERM sorting domain-containing protein, partial [Planctomycetes bacterium]|nr:PEP-CTERM sorting domain-containing protein [Planctomycetota bacterium]